MTPPISLDFAAGRDSSQALGDLARKVRDQQNYLKDLESKFGNEPYTYSGFVSAEEKSKLDQIRQLALRKIEVVRDEYEKTASSLEHVKDTVTAMFDGQRDNDSSATTGIEGIRS